MNEKFTSKTCYWHSLVGHWNISYFAQPKKLLSLLKYDSFKKDNQKNCWFQTCLLSSNFIVYETDQKLGPELLNAVDNRTVARAEDIYIHLWSR